MSGYIIYEGSSALNGEEIVVILTTNTKNPKTGDLIQSWILCKDTPPIEAINTGKDESICGNCPLKGNNGKNRACYVNRLGINQVWKSYKNGNYHYPNNLNFLKNRGLRLGSYGDPCAVGLEIWKPFIKRSLIHTGYTHQWVDPKFQEWNEYIMASVENEYQKQKANELGWKTFRIKVKEDLPLKDEIICPASEERNFSLQCINCGICNSKSSNVVVSVHGIGSKYFNAA